MRINLNYSIVSGFHVVKNAVKLDYGSKNKSNFHFTLLKYLLGIASCQKLSPQLAPRHTVQGCISGESMATCVILTDSGFELSSLQRQKSALVHLENCC